MQKPKSFRHLSGFTLVELIVVITILVILGTIAFVNIGGYSSNARDSTRVSDLTNIAKGLDILYAKNNVVLPPENGTNLGVITLTASGTIIGFQGAVGPNILSAVKMSGDGKDPLDKKSYTYATNLGYTKYQLLSLFEDSSTNIASIEGIDTTYAGYESRSIGVKGGQLGVLLSSDIGKLNQPIQENYSVGSFTGVDVVNTGSGYLAILSSKNIISGTGNNLKRLEIIYPNNPKLDTTTIVDVANGSLIGYWDMETLTSGGKLKDMSGNRNDGSGSGNLSIGDAPKNNKTGKGTNFDGINDFVSVGKIADYDIGVNQQKTVSFWMKGGVQQSTRYIIFKEASCLGWAFYITNTNLLTMSLTTGVANCTGYSTYGLTIPYPNDNAWHQITGVYDRTNTKMLLYLDGVLKNTRASDNVNPSNTNADFRIGTQYNNTAPFAGAIDEVRIYNNALSDSKVKELYDVTSN